MKKKNGIKKTICKHLKEDMKEAKKWMKDDIKEIKEEKKEVAYHKKSIADDKKLMKKVKNAKSVPYEKEKHEDYQY